MRGNVEMMDHHRVNEIGQLYAYEINSEMCRD